MLKKLRSLLVYPTYVGIVLAFKHLPSYPSLPLYATSIFTQVSTFMNTAIPFPY